MADGAWQRLLAITTLMLPMSLAGCFHQSDAQLDSSRELDQARLGTADQEARAKQLSARISELERRLDVDGTEQRRSERALLNRLDRLLQANEAAPARAASGTAGCLAPAPVTLNLMEAAAPAPAASPERELRGLLARWRGESEDAMRPLTREQSRALRILLKPERKLDSDNPWPGPWY